MRPLNTNLRHTDFMQIWPKIKPSGFPGKSRKVSFKKCSFVCTIKLGFTTSKHKCTQGNINTNCL